ncbi:MAG: alpha/beta fold hydrolase [Ignavibacteriales bacterium]|nr:alpha/beta fold hydrolase [Ignavibacteriales bacterium]
MKKILAFSIFIFIISSVQFAQSQQKYSEIGNLKLVNGDVLEKCVIGFRTFGKLNQDSSNALIFPTWFEGTTDDITRLIQKYSFLDTTKYFIIAIDALGNGVSSSPSNHNVYKIKSIPKITIRDMVNSQHKFITEKMKLNHLFGAVGGSLGAMQVLEWSIAYPNFISKIVAYVGTPKMSTYDLLWINAQLNIIEAGKKYGVTDKEIRKSIAMLMAVMGRTPDYFVEKIKREDFADYIKKFDNEFSSSFTLDDYEYQLKAISNHDISKEFNGSMEETAKQIKAKLFFIISETDLLINPTETKRFAGLTKTKTLLLNNNCGHLAVSCEIERCKKEIADFLDNE